MGWHLGGMREVVSKQASKQAWVGEEEADVRRCTQLTYRPGLAAVVFGPNMAAAAAPAAVTGTAKLPLATERGGGLLLREGDVTEAAVDVVVLLLMEAALAEPAAGGSDAEVPAVEVLGWYADAMTGATQPCAHKDTQSPSEGTRKQGEVAIGESCCGGEDKQKG